MSFSHLTTAMNSRTFMSENPVLVNARKGNLKCAKHALAEYSALIMGITTLLESVMNDADAAQMWGIVEELQRNIHEEEGELSHDVPHCIIIAEHFDHLGLGWPYGDLPSIEEWQQMGPPRMPDQYRLKRKHLHNYQQPTRLFIKNMMHLMRDKPTAFTIGMALALETSAGPELKFVARIINCLLADAGKELIPETVITGNGEDLSEFPKFSLNGFFAHHIHEWEEGHQGRLEWEIKQELNRDLNAEQLEAGFMAVLDLMNTWWNELAKL